MKMPRKENKNYYQIRIRTYTRIGKLRMTETSYLLKKDAPGVRRLIGLLQGQHNILIMNSRQSGKKTPGFCLKANHVLFGDTTK